MISSNYRLVRNFMFLSKVLEKVVLEQFTTYCDTHKLIPDYQSVYRKYFSCETSIIKVVNDILWNFENQEVCAMCMIDLSAAFDTVDHQILLQSRFGVSGSALDWFDSYLQPRFCKVNVGIKYSTNRPLDCSVPQGGLVGPNLYLAYTSSLQEIVSEEMCLNRFTDDHSLKGSFKVDDRKAEHTTISILQNCLKDVKLWMDENRL